MNISNALEIRTVFFKLKLKARQVSLIVTFCNL